MLQQVFEVDIRAILAALGVGGLAVALALQDTLSNLFAGFYVSVARQIRIGDFVKIDAGQSGYVQDIGWRSTTLRELGGNLIFIPNNKLSQSIVTNYNLPQRPIAVAITVPVASRSDPSQVERILTEIAYGRHGQVPDLLKDPAPSASSSRDSAKRPWILLWTAMWRSTRISFWCSTSFARRICAPVSRRRHHVSIAPSVPAATAPDEN